MERAKYTLTPLGGEYAVCRLGADARLPTWALGGALFSVTRTADELSIVCEAGLAPGGVRCEPGWRCLKVEGPFAFSVVGVLASLTGVLADAGVSLFAVSTFDTDYLLVRAHDFERAVAALRAGGHAVHR